MIDSHCHLNDETLLNNIDEILKSAKEEGVKYFLVVGYDVKSSQIAVDLANKYKEIYAAVGIHPTDSLKMKENDLEIIKELAINNKKVVAIGEIGLDYYWTKEEMDRNKQKQHFIEQIDLANALNLPIVVHSRDAKEDTLKVLKEHKVNNKGVMHCYSNGPGMIDEYLKTGFYISFGGPITFKNAIEPKESVIKCPLNRLLVETDSPYLTPHPYRGKTNEPKYVYLVLSKVAELKNISEEEVNKISDENFAKLFHVETK